MMLNEALEYALLAQELSPDLADAYYAAGNSYFAMRDIEKAKEQYFIALGKNPEHARANYVVSKLFLSEKKPEKALEHSIKALKNLDKDQLYMVPSINDIMASAYKAIEDH